MVIEVVKCVYFNLKFIFKSVIVLVYKGEWSVYVCYNVFVYCFVGIVVFLVDDFGWICF